MLHCVINLTEELAQRQAKRADEEIAAGTYRGPLHGIPWGVKDWLAVRGTKTTWGASPYKDQVIDTDATVYSRLTEAGAILVAKLSTSPLANAARGWFGGRTRNPWNTEQGAGQSSAGPASATAAGLVGFSIGTESSGSIVRPATRCGVTGLRPTFGRVSRYGVMVVGWTRDKIGPMCRAAEDCALVSDAIYGPDGKDNTVLDVPFNWDATADVTKLRVGYLRSVFEREIREDPENPERAARRRQVRRNYEAALQVIRALGVEVVPFELPAIGAWRRLISGPESAAAFDEPTRSGTLNMMQESPEESNVVDRLRTARFIPAVEYIQANRLRMRLIEEMDDALGDLDLFIGSHTDFLISRDTRVTNLTGHPAITMPSGFFQGMPTGLHFTGKLFGESEILLLADAFQARTDHHLKHPTL
ncbi:amidase [Acidobacteria bacterium AH-259-G07]|nr:amidase [Acidobacteria bacterium AH-259-G07]